MPVCLTGAYQQECAPRIVEETITVLDVDGIYFNMAGFQTYDYRGTDHGICHCAACAEGFRDDVRPRAPRRRGTSRTRRTAGTSSFQDADPPRIEANGWTR